jgi:ligand-binding sensor domain-containing protein
MDWTSAGFSILDGQGWTTHPIANVQGVAFDPQGRAWVATHGGVSIFDGTRWTAYNQANSGLSNDGVRAITSDNQGRAWIGTGAGVSIFDGSRRNFHSTPA